MVQTTLYFDAHRAKILSHRTAHACRLMISFAIFIRSSERAKCLLINLICALVHHTKIVLDSELGEKAASDMWV